MTLVNKILIGLCLVAIGLFGVVYFDAFAYYRVPSTATVDSDESGFPVRVVHAYDYQRSSCTLVGFVLTRTSDNTKVYGESIFYGSTMDSTFYNLGFGEWEVGLYQTGNNISGGNPCTGTAEFATYWNDSFIVNALVGITYPVDGATYLTEPNHFSVEWNLPDIYYSISYQYKEIFIRYGKTPEALYYRAIRDFTNIATSSEQSYISKVTNLNGEGYAIPTMLFCDEGFTICGNAIQGEMIHWNAPTTASITGDTPTDFGLVGNVFRDVGLWLFVPPSGSFNRFTTLADDIQEKPPIGYWTLIKDDFNNLASGSPTISWDLTAISSIIEPFKTGLAWILWILWAVWLLVRITKLDWHI